MSSSSITIGNMFCRVCMSSNSNLMDIFSTRLNDALDRLTGISCAVGDGLPRSLCFLCAALLRKCIYFRDAALATDRLLRDMAGRGSQTSHGLQHMHGKDLRFHSMCSTAPMVYSYPDLPSYSDYNPSDTEELGALHTISGTGEKPTQFSEVSAFTMDTNANNSTGDCAPSPQDLEQLAEGTHAYNCRLCKYKSNILANYKRHLLRHGTKKCFQCQECKKKFKAKDYLKKHLRTQHTDKPFECPKCMYISASVTQLKVHFRKHTFRRSDDESKSKDSSGDKPHQCSSCGSRFRQLGHLKRHFSRRHETEKILKCTDCDYRSNIISDLQIHMRKHTGEKPYKCTECNHACTTSSNLRAHFRRHTGEKPYHCSHCLKKFGTKTQLNEHFLTHTGEKRYNCTECGTRFGRLTHYRRHLQRNARVEPFSCAHCAYSCALKCGSTRHMAEHGGN